MKKTGEIDIRLGKVIVVQRAILGFSRKDLAEAIGITHQQMQKYEKGINRVSVARLYDIANVLKIPVIKFLETDADDDQDCNSTKCKSLEEIISYISKITDETKLLAIKNLVKSISVS